MKYYSERLDEVFDTEEELRLAEATLPEAQGKCDGDCDNCKDPCYSSDEDDLPADSIKKESLPTKKELADAVQKCDSDLKEAYNLYSVAEKKVEELSKKYLEEVDAILKPAKRAVRSAEEKKFEAVKRFNDIYGVYRVSYTGEKAAEEFNRAIDRFYSRRGWFDDLFRLF